MVNIEQTGSNLAKPFPQYKTWLKRQNSLQLENDTKPSSGTKFEFFSFNWHWIWLRSQKQAWLRHFVRKIRKTAFCKNPFITNTYDIGLAVLVADKLFWRGVIWFGEDLQRLYISEYVFIISIYSRFLLKLSFTIDCQHMNVSCTLKVNINEPRPQYLGSVKKKTWLWISIVLRVRLALSRGVHFLNRKVVTRHD